MQEVPKSWRRNSDCCKLWGLGTSMSPYCCSFWGLGASRRSQQCKIQSLGAQGAPSTLTSRLRVQLPWAQNDMDARVSMPQGPEMLLFPGCIPFKSPRWCKFQDFGAPMSSTCWKLPRFSCLWGLVTWEVCLSWWHVSQCLADNADKHFIYVATFQHRSWDLWPEDTAVQKLIALASRRPVFVNEWLIAWIPLLPWFPGNFGDSVEFGRFRGNSGNFGKIQGNSVGFCMALSMNSVGIPGGFGATPDFQQKIWGLGWFRAIWGVKRLLRK